MAHRIPADELRSFTRSALEAVGLPTREAKMTADVLVAADLRGHESHGVARLDGFYVKRLEAGEIATHATPETLRETATSLAIDADNAMGHPVSIDTMERTIAKARESGFAFATVRNSNHFGMAGYYAMQALPHDMIGIASTNTSRLATPTFGREALLGTNPFAYAVPAGEEPAFVLDFATTTVALGKLEVAQRRGEPLKPGWALDIDGHPTLDAARGLAAGLLLPLGGAGTDNGGHKGYGLAVLCSILTGVLGGGTFGRDMPAPNLPRPFGSVAHFFGAMRVDRFREIEAFKADMDLELRAFKNSTPAPGRERVYVAGEPELERTAEQTKNGIALNDRAYDGLREMAQRIGITFTLEAF